MADTEETPVADHVPETPAPPTEPTPPPANDDSLRTTVEKLEQTVNGLVERIELLTPDPRDSTPTKTPWTHRFGSGR